MMEKVNPNFPANPCQMQRVGENAYRPYKEGDPKEYRHPHGGIPIKLHIATQLMSGLLAAWGSHDVTSMDELADDALRGADELIHRYNQSIQDQ